MAAYAHLNDKERQTTPLVKGSAPVFVFDGNKGSSWNNSATILTCFSIVVGVILWAATTFLGMQDSIHAAETRIENKIDQATNPIVDSVGSLEEKLNEFESDRGKDMLDHLSDFHNN